MSTVCKAAPLLAAAPHGVPGVVAGVATLAAQVGGAAAARPQPSENPQPQV